MFLRNTFKTGLLLMTGGLQQALVTAQTFAQQQSAKDPLFNRLLLANDKQVAGLLPAIQTGPLVPNRKIGFDFAILAASYCTPGSAYYQDMLVILALQKIVDLLLHAQAEDGTLNFANLESPPDTAFLLEPVSTAAYILQQQPGVTLDALHTDLKRFIVRSGSALVMGGVHTPNHRWLVCAVLARVHILYPDQSYLNRIEDWLDEGVYIDGDGHFPERSINYAVVEDNALLTIARLLHKPALQDIVRRNLEMNWYYTEPNGEMVTTDSRRQDQYGVKSVLPYYLHYRYLAIKDNNRRLAAITQWIEELEGFEELILNKCLFHFIENPLLQQPLPPGIMPPVQYEKLFATSHLLRIRDGHTTATLFGGTDQPLLIASGRSNSPNFFSFRKGKAVLKYVRFSAAFFSTGYFYSEGLEKTGKSYWLHQKREVLYYQPLPREYRNKEGDYALSPSTDGRFWNKMDFEHRPVSNVKTLETNISFSSGSGAYELLFEVTGQAGVAVTIELCFGTGGVLSGVSDGEHGNSFLAAGQGTYTVGSDIIHFGPGTVTHRSVSDLSGELYSSHFGSLQTEGMHVYLTGTTPFTHRLVIS